VQLAQSPSTGKYLQTLNITGQIIANLSLSVAIPTYKRPDFICRSVTSLFKQLRGPCEIIVVSREDDQQTNEAVANLFRKAPAGIKTINIRIREPGFLPPINAAIGAASGDVLAFLDDDAEAHPDWLARIADQYSSLNIGGVGGRYINYFSGVLQHYPPARVVGKVFWYGRCVGNLYRDCMFKLPVDVDFLIGGNMSYRLNVLRQCSPDHRLNSNVAAHWEVDIGLQVKRLGYRIIFDPSIRVDHHSAPRVIEGMRSVNSTGIYSMNYNYALLMRKHLSSWGFAAYVAYSYLIGGAGSPGLAYILWDILRCRPIYWRESVAASFRGRFDGMRILKGRSIEEQ
jgi:glycosyltransferase involved in cell wall biosynthesis